MRELQRYDAFQFVHAEPLENHQIIDAVQEFRGEVGAQGIHYLPTEFFGHQPRIGNPLTADVRGHDDNRVFEIDGAALSISHPAIVQHLEEDVEYLRMRFLHLIQ